jgi:pyruvate-ferredoxin/flavodoxin oxidoreductase
VEAFRDRALSPDRPRVKVGQQARTSISRTRDTNRQYAEATDVIETTMAEVGAVIGRAYKPFDYVGHPEAEHVIVAMGSACETIEEAITYLNEKRGMKLGLVKVRVYRPFSAEHFIRVLPATVKNIAVLDRTKEPGSLGEPLYLDVVSALKDRKDTFITGGRYASPARSSPHHGACHL